MNFANPNVGLRARDPDTSMKDVDQLLRLIAKTQNPSERLRMAENARASARVISAIEKAAEPASTVSTLGSTTIGEAFGSFYSQARNLGAADLMAESAVRMPKGYGRFNIMSSVIASTVSEGQPKPVRKLSLSTSDTVPVKGTAQIVLTKEVLDGLDAANAMASIRTELVRSITGWTDSALLAALTGNSGGPLSSDTVANFVSDDFAELLKLVGSSSQSRLFMIVRAGAAKMIAAHLLSLGINVPWPRFELAGVTVVASDEQDDGRVTLVDASSLAMWLGPVEVRSSEIADVGLSSEPTNASAPTVVQNQLTSLFSTNSIALLAERSASFKALRSNSYVHLTGLGFGESDSPGAI